MNKFIVMNAPFVHSGNEQGDENQACGLVFFEVADNALERVVDTDLHTVIKSCDEAAELVRVVQGKG